MIVTFSRLGRYGRLGNGMYQIASTIGIARKNGFEFGFPIWRNYDGRQFEPEIDIEVSTRFINTLPLYDGPELAERFVSWGYHDVVLTESVNLLGHMQSERYFAHCLDEVKYYFRMIDEPGLNDYCALCYRAGDYTEGHDTYHPRMPLDYYLSAMGHFGAQQKFLVFSDDMPAARGMFGDKVDYRSEELDYLDQFRLLKRCSHFIIANSSFSAMAAILGDAPGKQVIAPRPWFGKVAGITGEDIYDSSWEIVNWEEQVRAAA